MRCRQESTEGLFVITCAIDLFKPYEVNPFSSPVFSSFLPHLLLYFHITSLCALSFSARKVFLAAFSAFFGKVDGWGGEGEKKRSGGKLQRKERKEERKEQTTENKKTHQTKVWEEENNGMMC